MPIQVEILSFAAAAAHRAAWQHLCDNALEPNIFLEPDFALAAALHLARRRPPHFLFAWDGDGTTRQLLGLWPLAAPGGLACWLPARIWTHEQAPLGTPLLDRARAEAALAAIFDHCRRVRRNGAGLMLPLLPQAGAVAQLVMARATAEGREIRIFGAGERAILSGGQAPQEFLQQSITATRRRKLKRARAALEAQGAITFRTIREPSQIDAAAAAFFALEAKGWKGARGTAFLKSADRAAFAHAAVAALARAGKCFLASLDLDGRPLAMALMLASGGRAYWWKIAYDEAFAAASPGVLLAVEMTQLLLGDAEIALTDSCTSDEHPMIEHIWSERMAIADLLIETDAGQRKAFHTLARREALRRSARTRLKQLVSRLRRLQKPRSAAPG
jgi:CelD/BcsL family acetyltransferase involved in cellulose biosynthesis